MFQIEMSPKVTTKDDSRETILVVDDNEIVLAYAATVLNRANYHVLTAQGPEPALSVAGGYQRTIDLLVTDYEMPDLNGVELARALIRSRHPMRVLIMSGRNREDIAVPENAQFIAKPFTPRALLSLVEEILSTATCLREDRFIARSESLRKR